MSAAALCAAIGAHFGAEAEPTTLVIEASQASAIPTNAFFNQANIDAFHLRNPGIRISVKLIPDHATLNAYRGALSSESPPDIMIYSKVSAENELDAMRTMVDMSGEPWAKRLERPDLLRSPDGRIYLFQRMVAEGGIGVVYNKAVFERLGIGTPGTYGDFLAACERIKSAGLIPLYGPFKDTWTFQIWTTAAWGTLAERVKPDLWSRINSGKLKWTEVPEFREILERGMRLIRQGYFQPTMLSDDYRGAAAAFRSGKFAMMFMTHSFLVEMKEAAPELRLGMFAIPAYDDPKLNVLSQGQIGGAVVPKKARHRAEALRFFDFLAQPEQIARDLAVPALAYQPNFADVPARYDRPPVLQSIYDDYVRAGRVSTEMNAYMKVGVTDLWLYYQDMLAGLKTPEQALAAWDRKFRSLMKQKGYPGF